ncbi:DUF3887 domain-containing protein [Amnibacterium sp.]|uniref:DUF3887 domain-containing protein n=1 Tax=Amnibacterium sp. TaxID=1872496 RepID=UPI003F7C291E
MTDDVTDQVAALRRELDLLLATPVLQGDDAPLAVVRSAAGVQAGANALLASAVERARSGGCTWQQIGEVLGISRQAAFQRFGRPVDPRTGAAMSTTPLPDAVALAEAVIADLVHARWSDVTARFDAVVAERLGADGLAAAWAQVIGAVGAFEGRDEVHAARAGDLTVTNTLLRFEAGEFVARIAFRDDRSIAGLFLLPPDRA